MKKMYKKSLKAKSLFIFIELLFISSIAYADMPVIDFSNLAQTTTAARKSIEAVETQYQQYYAQLQQLNDALINSTAPSSYIWDQANEIINKLLAATDTLMYYKNQAGNINNYLSRYQDMNYYSNSPCFSDKGCTDQQRQALVTAQANGSEAQKKANDAMLLGIDQQQASLKVDSENLQKLQAQATTAKGRMAAIQAANQLASAQANQLFQIRALLVAQQNAQATRAQVIADKEAQEAASHQQLLKGHFEKSTDINWTPDGEVKG